ncbi:hypothetical protein [Symbioplanes lichenis]|uniref:hypothetical protein n=1 Tax=Symbioplanes lichenis TaxID=1629072 RepID=UPI002738E6B8|nr:hypothetical protein [Actinoplanes lichenis]
MEPTAHPDDSRRPYGQARPWPAPGSPTPEPQRPDEDDPAHPAGPAAVHPDESFPASPPAPTGIPGDRRKPRGTAGVPNGVPGLDLPELGSFNAFDLPQPPPEADHGRMPHFGRPPGTGTDPADDPARMPDFPTLDTPGPGPGPADPGPHALRPEPIDLGPHSFRPEPVDPGPHSFRPEPVDPDPRVTDPETAGSHPEATRPADVPPLPDLPQMPDAGRYRVPEAGTFQIPPPPRVAEPQQPWNTFPAPGRDRGTSPGDFSRDDISGYPGDDISGQPLGRAGRPAPEPHTDEPSRSTHEPEAEDRQGSAEPRWPHRPDDTDDHEAQNAQDKSDGTNGPGQPADSSRRDNRPPLPFDAQMVALGSRRPTEALLGGLLGGLRRLDEGPARINGHANGHSANGHAGPPVTNGYSGPSTTHDDEGPATADAYDGPGTANAYDDSAPANGYDDPAPADGWRGPLFPPADAPLADDPIADLFHKFPESDTPGDEPPATQAPADEIPATTPADEGEGAGQIGASDDVAGPFAPPPQASVPLYAPSPFTRAGNPPLPDGWAPHPEQPEDPQDLPLSDDTPPPGEPAKPYVARRSAPDDDERRPSGAADDDGRQLSHAAEHDGRRLPHAAEDHERRLPHAAEDERRRPDEVGDDVREAPTGRAQVTVTGSARVPEPGIGSEPTDDLGSVAGLPSFPVSGGRRRRAEPDDEALTVVDAVDAVEAVTGIEVLEGVGATDESSAPENSAEESSAPEGHASEGSATEDRATDGREERDRLVDVGIGPAQHGVEQADDHSELVVDRVVANELTVERIVTVEPDAAEDGDPRLESHAAEDEVPQLEGHAVEDRPEVGDDLGRESAGDDLGVAQRRPGDVGGTAISFWDEAAGARFRGEWHEVKAQFVDDPVSALERARDLISDAVGELSAAMLAERDELDPLRETSTPDTESMRMAMRNYRDFLDRILDL